MSTIAREHGVSPETVRRYIRRRIDYKQEIARLDAISRTRALTDLESIMLERFIWRVDKKGRGRAPYGTNKELARAGIERRAI